MWKLRSQGLPDFKTTTMAVHLPTKALKTAR